MNEKDNHDKSHTHIHHNGTPYNNAFYLRNLTAFLSFPYENPHLFTTITLDMLHLSANATPIFLQVPTK